MIFVPVILLVLVLMGLISGGYVRSHLAYFAVSAVSFIAGAMYLLDRVIRGINRID